MSARRLALITSSFPASPEDSKNAGVFVRDVARQLARLGHEVTVITPMRVQAQGEPYAVSSFPWPGTETSLTHITPRGWRNLFRLGMLLASGVAHTLMTLRRNRTQYVIAMWAVPSGLLALAARRLLGTPYSVWVLGSDIWEIDTYPLGRPLVKRVLAGADQVYADGRQLASDVEGISGRPCTYLPASRSLPETMTVHRPEADPSYRHLLAVARYHPHKGLDVLVDALGLLSAEDSELLRVHIFGDGPQRAELEVRIADRGLAGWVSLGSSLNSSELAGWMSVATALVIPSRIDSVPLIVLDAAQHSCPVIATDVGDLGAVVSEYGLGVVVPAEDPPALASAIAAAVAGDIAYDRGGAARVVRDFSVDASCRTLLARIERPSLGSEGTFDRKAYWERRLGEDFSLTAVGVRRLGKSFNEWAYRLRGERFADVVHRYAGALDRAAVLDVGSGTGFYIDRLRELGAGRIVGSDLAENAVDELRRRFPFATFNQFDVSGEIPSSLAAGTFDLVCAMDVLFHVLDSAGFDRSIRNVHSLLRPGGIFIWTDGFAHARRRGQRHIVSRTLAEATAVVESAGFEILSREPFLVTMNAPVDTRVPFAVPLWKLIVASAAATDRMGARLGKLLYSLDRRLVRRLHESPSIEIMVCRKK